MKNRIRFVSNSSSSSFIVIGDEPSRCNSVLLEKEQRKKVLGYLKLDIPDDEVVYLTDFVCEGDTEVLKVPRDKIHFYADGGHGHPYSEKDYYELEDAGVWIMKEHFSADGEAEKIIEWIRREVLGAGFTLDRRNNTVCLEHPRSGAGWEIIEDEE